MMANPTKKYERFHGYGKHSSSGTTEVVMLADYNKQLVKISLPGRLLKI